MAKKQAAEVSAELANVGVSKLSQNRASALLARLRDEGKSIQHDLFPSINKALVEEGPDAMFAGIVVSEVQKNAVPSTLPGQEGQFSDTIVLKNLGGEKETAIFYASNKGAKAKLNGIKTGHGVLIYYRGTQASNTKGFNDWHDFGIEEFMNPTDLVSFVEAAKA